MNKKENRTKNCPRCRHLVTSEDHYCPNCSMMQPYQQASARDDARNRKPTKKRKLGKAEWITIIALAAIFGLIVLMNVAPGGKLASAFQQRRQQKMEGTTTAVDAASQPRTPAESDPKTLKDEELEQPIEEIVAIQPGPLGTFEYQPGEEFLLHDQQTAILMADRKPDMEKLLADEGGSVQADLLADKKLVSLPAGTRITIIDMLDGIAFVDVLGGPNDGQVGYIDIRTIGRAAS